MADPKRGEISVHQERAILVAVVISKPGQGNEEPLEELRGLAKTAGVEVVGTLVQNRHAPDLATYLGKGKVAELKQLIEQTDAAAVIFDNSLSPAQGRNLEEELNIVIVDRCELILAIFATHASSYEARLQVELAQLQYTRSRLKRMWTHLERIAGAVTSRGPGEQQIEIDRRLIDARVSELRSKLKVVETRRERIVSQRRDHLTVSLVGYTNAGKSTLMNALTGADVYVADQLFATLDTRTRTWDIPHLGPVLLSDTVGFIRDLPHKLVASFRSTLEEARHAGLLLHVVDASHPAAEQQIATVNEVLDEIGIDGRQAVLVLNKADAVEDRSFLDVLRAAHPQAISVSALERTGLDQLTHLVAERIGEGSVQATVETGVGNGRLFAYLAEHAEVTQTDYHDARVTFQCRIPRRCLAGLPRDDLHVRLANGESEAEASGNGHLDDDDLTSQ